MTTPQRYLELAESTFSSIHACTEIRAALREAASLQGDNARLRDVVNNMQDENKELFNEVDTLQSQVSALKKALTDIRDSAFRSTTSARVIASKALKNEQGKTND